MPVLTDPTTNLRTTLMEPIARAGYEPWPRLIHNMRAGCATDWAEALPAHVVAKWLGHSPLVAARHYLQTRDAHFEVAIRGIAPEPWIARTRIILAHSARVLS